jgi:hypothetical protein
VCRRREGDASLSCPGLEPGPMLVRDSSVPGLQRIISLALMLRSARDTISAITSRSRGMICPSFAKVIALLKHRGRRECRVRAAPAVSCAKSVHFGAHEHTGQRKHSDIPCAMALRRTSCSPRWSGLVVTVTPEKLASQELGASIAAPGPHDLAVRLCSSVRTLTRT